MSFIDDAGAPPLQTVQFKDNITAQLLRLAIDHKLFHNDVKWDNIKYDKTRNRAVLLDFDWATSTRSGFPFFGPMHLPIVVGHRSDVVHLCALATPTGAPKPDDPPQTVWLYSLDQRGSVHEHCRRPTGWDSRDLTRELQLEPARTLACTVVEGCKTLYLVGRDGRLYELALGKSGDPRPRGAVHIGGAVRLHAASEVVCATRPTDAGGQQPPTLLVFVDGDGRLHALERQRGPECGPAQWESDSTDLDPPPVMGSGYRIAAGLENSGTLSVFYVGEGGQLCRVTWRGRGMWRPARLSTPHGVPQSLAVAFPSQIGHRGAAHVFYTTDAGDLWEARTEGLAAKWGIFTHTRLSQASIHNLSCWAGAPLIAGPLPRSRAEGGGCAGAAVVAVIRGPGLEGGFLRRFFTGGGLLEGAADTDWHEQELTEGRPHLRSAPLAEAGPGAALCALASAGGAHHVFYAAQGGAIVEL